MRTFETGATRSDLEGKPQYEGYLSPLALYSFGQYMLKHQLQEDGTVRAADNWQKGMPLDSYMDSMWRHFMDVWAIHRGYGELATAKSMEEALNALMFNVQAYQHTILKEK